MRFDPSGLYGAMDAMRDKAQSQGKDLVDKLGGEFLADMKKESWKEAPNPEELVQTAKKLKWRLKRKPGVSPGRELKRRIRARGTFARKWRIWKTEASKWSYRLWLIDEYKTSEEVDREKKVSDRAEKITGRKFKIRLDALADKLCRFF